MAAVMPVTMSMGSCAVASGAARAPHHGGMPSLNLRRAGPARLCVARATLQLIDTRGALTLMSRRGVGKAGERTGGDWRHQPLHLSALASATEPPRASVTTLLTRRLHVQTLDRGERRRYLRLWRRT